MNVRSRSLHRAAVLIALILTFGLITLPSARAASTNGAGGPFADVVSQSFKATNGLSSQYHLYAEGIDPTRSIGLMVQFHGDGAYEFKNPNSSYSLGGAEGLRAQAKRHNMILLVALTPDKVGEITWWESGSQNSEYARDLIQSVAYARFNIDRTRTWLVGYSGGSEFITRFLLPKHSSLFEGGGAVVFGGGGEPWYSHPPFAESLRRNYPMYWYTGLADTVGYDALSDARSGSAYFAKAGFPVTLDTPPGVTHNLSGKFGPITGQQLDKHDVVPTATPTTTPRPTATPTTTPKPTATPTTTPTATSKPTATPVVWKHSIKLSKGKVTLKVDIPKGTSRTTFRVTANPPGVSGGWHEYSYTKKTGKKVKLKVKGLKAGRTYYYQIENGLNGEVVGSGKFAAR